MDMVLEQNSENADFEVKQIELYIPKWLETLSTDHPVKYNLIEKIRDILKKGTGVPNFVETCVDELKELEFVNNVSIEQTSDEMKEALKIRMDVDDVWYYEMLSNLTGVTITGEYQLIAMIKELSALKNEYCKAKQALLDARNIGYGVITPEQKEIHMDEPVIIRHGNKYGVKMKASCPAIHLIKTELEIEISPIVGNEQQAEDLITYIKKSSSSEDGIWDTNIFGKSIEQLTEDGILMKLSQIGEASQQKLQNMMQRIVNETTGGFICVIL